VNRTVQRAAQRDFAEIYAILTVYHGHIEPERFAGEFCHILQQRTYWTARLPFISLYTEPCDGKMRAELTVQERRYPMQDRGPHVDPTDELQVVEPITRARCTVPDEDVVDCLVEDCDWSGDPRDE
jgi:hypothetical protein